MIMKTRNPSAYFHSLDKQVQILAFVIKMYLSWLVVYCFKDQRAVVIICLDVVAIHIITYNDLLNCCVMYLA